MSCLFAFARHSFVSLVRGTCVLCPCLCACRASFLCGHTGSHHKVPQVSHTVVVDRNPMEWASAMAVLPGEVGAPAQQSVASAKILSKVQASLGAAVGEVPGSEVKPCVGAPVSEA